MCIRDRHEIVDSVEKLEALLARVREAEKIFATYSQATHTGTLGLRIRESKAKIQHFRVSESIVEATTTGSSVNNMYIWEISS